MKKLLTFLLLGGFITASAQTARLSMSATRKYQHIDGFGGTGMNGQWADVYTQAKVNMLWGKGKGQIGLNIMRVRINPNEGNWGEYGNAIKWARKHGVTVFATPWTPPKKYKTQNTNKYQNDFGTWVWPLYEHTWGGQGSNGGAIDPAHIDEYADFLERYRATMEKKGCPIDMISIQNECDYTPTATDNGVEHASYESCIFSPKEMAQMVKAARAKVDPKCKIMGPETFGWGQSNYNKTLAGMADAVNNIDVWGNHLYGSNDWTYINTVTSKTKKPMWMTEFLIDYDKSKYKGEFSAEYQMIESLENAMKNGYSGYVYYNMLNDFFACNHGGSETELWKRAYVFSHYAKYATGKTRILSSMTTTSDLLGGSTYASENGDTISVFVLNKSKKTYNFTISLPFAPEGVTQVATNESCNALTLDVTDLYKGMEQPKVKLLPETFYTFQFVKNTSQTEDEEPQIAAETKSASNVNPICVYNYMADPTSVEHDGRLYVYATNDQMEYDESLGIVKNTYGKITQLVCLSTADMVNWTHHGVIDVKAIAPWIVTSWAPSIVSREEADGKTHFYMYFTNTAAGIGVLTATSPLGPWRDPLGKALIDGNTPGLGKLSNIIDPGVSFYNGKAYLTFGGGDVTDTELFPGNARIVQLGDDMISLASDIVKLPAPCHFEANELNQIGDKLVYSYCTRWSIASDWKTTFKSLAAPEACSMVFMVSDDPLNPDSWTYKGEFMPNPGTLGNPYGNNHTHIQKFNNTYYLLYHNQWLENKNGLSGGYRNLAVARLGVSEGTPRITKATTSTASLSGPSQISANRPDPYVPNQASMTANSAGVKAVATDVAGNMHMGSISSGDWMMVRGVPFDKADADGKARTAKSVGVRVKGSGTLEIRESSLTGNVLATIPFDCADFTEVRANLTKELGALTYYLYFVFTSAKDVEFDSWQFYQEDEATGIELTEDAAKVDDDTKVVEVYSLDGKRLAAPAGGKVNIIRTSHGNRKVKN